MIIVNWNGWPDTLACLESVRHQDFSNYLMIVVDNGSTNDSIQRIQQWCQQRLPGESVTCFLYSVREAELGGKAAIENRIPAVPSARRLVLIRAHENLGFAEANNIAFRYVLKSRWQADFMFLLNNDALIDRMCLQHAVRVAEQNGAGIVGARILDYERHKVVFSGDQRRPEFFYMRPRRRSAASEGNTRSMLVLGSGMLIRRDVLLAHQRRFGHFFNARLFMYGEETEFCLHILKLGIKIMVAGRANVFHKECQSVAFKERRPMQLYYQTRNSVAIAKSSLSILWRQVFYLIFFPARLRFSFWQLARGNRPEAEAIMHGIWDGCRGRLGIWSRHPQKPKSII